MLYSRQEDMNVDAGTAEGEVHEEAGVETSSDASTPTPPRFPPATGASGSENHHREAAEATRVSQAGPLSFLASILRSSHHSTLHITTSNLL
jgi:hypothetical protein